MRRLIEVAIERWPLRVPFRIARGVRSESELVIVSIRQGGVFGRGECAPNARYGESALSVAAEIRSIDYALAAGLSRLQLLDLLPPGSARCAVDCALWDLEIRLGLAPPLLEDLGPMVSARTIGIDEPRRMVRAAEDLGDPPLVKIKVDGAAPEVRIEQVRAALPNARLIIDANESWTMDQVDRLQPLLAATDVALLEQPLPAHADEALEGYRPRVPIAADESCRAAADIAGLRNRYQYINIKLDKTGGLTEALLLVDTARAANLGVMVGCMVGTSLSIAPALPLAAQAAFVDLDGPWLLARDREGGVRFTADGMIHPPAPGFWGSQQKPASAGEF